LNDHRLAMPSQSVNFGAETCVKCKLTSPCLLAIPAFATGGGECGPCPDFAPNTLEFASQLRKITETSLRVSKWRSAVKSRKRFVYSTWSSRAMASTGLLFPAALGFRVRRRGHPSVSVNICRVAVLGGSPHQLTLSQCSRSGL